MSLPKVVFAGTPDFAVPNLEALLRADVELVAVFTQPDRPAGRGRKLQASPVKAAALAHGIPVHQPSSFRNDPAALAVLTDLAPDLIVVVAYGLILPPSVLQIPHRGCINVHASLLPRWRGAAPIQRAILAGDRTTGITIMGMEQGLDTGPMVLTKTVPIAAAETGGSLHDKLAPLGAQALIEALPSILDGSATPRPQDDADATYASKLTKAEASIDWRRPAAEIDRLVRAFDPWPVAQTRIGAEVLRIWSARPLGAADAATDTDTDAATVAGAPPPTPGCVLACGRDGIDVATGAGILRITRLQPPGKRAMSAADFLNARSLKGETLG